MIQIFQMIHFNNVTFFTHLYSDMFSQVGEKGLLH